MRPGLMMAGVLTALWAGSAWAQPACPTPTRLTGFSTCADVAKAEEEGSVVLYTTDPEEGAAQVMAKFHKAFPKITTTYLRLQAGALYAKVMSERRAASYLVDVMQLSDLGFVLDFQKHGNYAHYVSPELAAFKPDYKSTPEGYWVWGSVIVAGIAYNPKTVPEDQAPKSWRDLLDPKWADAISVKVSNSGLQHETWFELKRLYGDEYWTKFATQQPRAFDSYVQQYDRVVNGQDKILATGQYSGYLQFKAKGAPIAFVYPSDGLPAGPETYGIVGNAPHPEAAKLFMDWFLSVPGQIAAGRGLFLNSVRADVPPPPGGIGLGELKLLYPADWEVFLASRPQFSRFWDKITGMR
jgi:iron(III) transport system substrate-binding protein